MATYGGPRGPGRRAAELAPMIDHTLLRADATEADVRQLCAEAAEWKFASVCVNPSWVPLASQQLKGTGVMVCTVIGFPLGATDARSKGDETRHAVAAGADEIDMVLNVGAMKSKDYETVARDIAAVVQAAAGKTVKVILETVYLSDEEKVAACLLSRETGAHFVKTSTGFGPGGATAADIALMRRIVGPVMGVKASGGIRDTATALKMVEAGASRLGCSASVAIVKGASASGGGY
ncbi:MAG: deoxyribose-phosphate aldolase [Candidatus Sericytochromatia bacterium]|nr:deoxyribose-phosphate aldolase [Candidatus Sericytochromatia bacterium]